MLSTMKIISAFCFFVAILDYVQSDSKFNKTKWRGDTRDFVTEAKKNIWRKYEKGNRLCSDLRQHLISFEEGELFDLFRHCDSIYDHPEACYKYHDKIFRDKVDIATAPSTCTNKSDMCSLWSSVLDELSKTSRVSSCLYFQTSRTMIQIWETCSFWDPVVNAERDLQTYIGSDGSGCLTSNLESKTQAINEIRKKYAFCENKISQILDSVQERVNSKCDSWIQYHNASSRMNDCYGTALTTFQRHIENSDENIRNCKKLSDPAKA